MADAAESLAALRAIRLPPDAGAGAGEVALAVAAGLVAALLIAAFVPSLTHRRASVRDMALTELSATRHLAPSERLAAQAKLLRRIVRIRDGEGVAALEGSVWLRHLDRTFNTSFFTRGRGRSFVDHLYRPAPDLDPAVIDTALVAIFRRLRG